VPSIRYRAHGWVCAVVLHEIPDGETAYVRNKLISSGSPTWAPVRWLGFICAHGSKAMSWARPGKLNACAVTNGSGLSSEWRELQEDEYVRAIIVQIDDCTFGAYGIVGKDYWPVIMSDTKPLLRLVTPSIERKVLPLSKRASA
jgi:hypothetical protein